MTTHLRTAAVHAAVARNAAQEAVALLNDASTPCSCCGLNRHADWDEAQIATQLRATADKLDKLMDRLRRLAAQREEATI